MRPQAAKQVLNFWASGSYVSTGLVKDAIGVLVRPCHRNLFVEACLDRRQRFEDAVFGAARSPSTLNTPKTEART